jgi:hypothetical protein
MKIALRFHFTSIRMPIIKKTNPTNAGENGGRQKEHFPLLVEMYFSVATMEISIEFPQKTENIATI